MRATDTVLSIRILFFAAFSGRNESVIVSQGLESPISEKFLKAHFPGRWISIRPFIEHIQVSSLRS
jgi:hypothetical protein